MGESLEAFALLLECSKTGNYQEEKNYIKHLFSILFNHVQTVINTVMMVVMSRQLKFKSMQLFQPSSVDYSIIKYCNLID